VHTVPPCWLHPVVIDVFPVAAIGLLSAWHADAHAGQGVGDVLLDSGRSGLLELLLVLSVLEVLFEPVDQVLERVVSLQVEEESLGFNLINILSNNMITFMNSLHNFSLGM
jgi:hypothetical protein